MPAKIVMAGAVALTLAGAGAALADRGSASRPAAKPQIRDIDAYLLRSGRLGLETEIKGDADRVRLTYAGRHYAARVVDTDAEEGTKQWARTVRARRADRAGGTTTRIGVRACDGGDCSTRSKRLRLELPDD